MTEILAGVDAAESVNTVSAGAGLGRTTGVPKCVPCHTDALVAYSPGSAWCVRVAPFGEARDARAKVAALVGVAIAVTVARRYALVLQAVLVAGAIVVGLAFGLDLGGRHAAGGGREEER